MTLQSGKAETDIAQQCVNRRYIGVPPKAEEEFKLPVCYPTNSSSELFRYEDERYYIDLNIQRYKVVLKSLEDVSKIEDENIKRQKLAVILSKNVFSFSFESLKCKKKMTKQKYDLEETKDEAEKLRKVIIEISHDVISTEFKHNNPYSKLENLYKKRANSDLNVKKKKNILYPLAVREREIRYAANEKQLMGTSSIFFMTLFSLNY